MPVFALHNLASLPHISVARACSTATHGLGEKNGNLATAVSALGDVITLSRKSNGEAFQGVVVGLGSMGVITKVTVEIQATCTRRQCVYETMPHFRMGFTPCAGKELQSEYFVPRRHAVEAILAIERLRDQISPHLLISEIRTVAADNLWISPCYERPSVTIHFTWKQDWPAVRKLLPVIEKELGVFEVRPHRGKLFAMSPAELKSGYKRLRDFLQLSKEYDPERKFRNAFLDRYIFSG